MTRHPPRDNYRRASGSLNKHSIRSALFDAAARSADSFSSVASRWSLSRRRRSRSDSKPRFAKRRSFHTTPIPYDDGSPSLRTNTPFVIPTTVDDRNNNTNNNNAHNHPFPSFASDAHSAASLHHSPAYMHPALRPTFDALRLLRKIPHVMAGWVHIKVPVGPPRMRWSAWTMFWAELRGGYLLLTRDFSTLHAVTDSACHNPVHYIFGATNCTITKTPTRGGAVRLSLVRKSPRSENNNNTSNANNPSANPVPAVLQEPRLSERSVKSTQSEASARRKGLARAVRNLFASRRRSSAAPPHPSSQDPNINNLSDLVLKIPSAPEADKWEWALNNSTHAYESKPLGDFQLIDALGAGAFGRVYLVYDSVKNEYLALKVLEKSLVFKDRLHFESAVNERLTLELVRGQPFMAQLRYAFQTTLCLYLVTDFYEGGDLFSFLRSHHKDVRESQAIRIIAEVILALQSMHEMGIVYRDLKPENVLLDRDGHVRLADLGLAKLLDRDNDYLTSTICGSLSYAAPEMLSEKQYGIAFDMWTLGVFIYQILTGEMPFQTDERSRQEILEDQHKAEFSQNGLSDDGYALVRALLQPNPLRRPTCQDLRRYPIFNDIDWDDLRMKKPHQNSVKQVMEKIATDAKKQAKESGVGQTVGGESDVFLLRNFDPDEWSDMSFSDVSDGVSTASYFRPDFTVSEQLPTVTKMVPGWSLTTDNAVPLIKPQLAAVRGAAPISKDNPRHNKRLSEKR